MSMVTRRGVNSTGIHRGDFACNFEPAPAARAAILHARTPCLRGEAAYNQASGEEVCIFGKFPAWLA
jgi:hypothetical protein